MFQREFFFAEPQFSVSSLFVLLMDLLFLQLGWQLQKGFPKDVKYGFLFPYNSWTNRLAVWRFVKDIPVEPNHPTKQALEKTANSLQNFTKTPAIACWGLDDFCFHEQFLNEWEKRWPQLQSHRFNDTGHYLLEDNFERCRSVIEPFLFPN